MIRQTELRKYAKKHLASGMAARGFSCLPKKEDYYYRQVGEIYHIVWIELNRAGSEMRVMVHATVPEAYKREGYEKDYFEKKFPAVAAYTGDYLRPDGLDGAYYWKAGNEEEAIKSFEDMLNAIDHVAIPWFQRISSREELVKVIKPEFRNHPLSRNLPDLILRK